jgi:DNA polymerase-3 subunit delta'
MSIWERLVGQPNAIEQLQSAVVDAHGDLTQKASSMTHAWLVTGPPGAGRSTAAILFAAALVCEQQGCGVCADCQQILSDTHPDVTRFVPEQITITRDEAEELMRASTIRPSRGRYRVTVIEDADRLSDVSGNMLLKSIEEPGPSMVWLLCTPNADDVLPTIRSRCRVLQLATPAWQDVANLLVAEGISRPMADMTSRVAQGHVGRARALATDEASRTRRQQIMQVPSRLTDLAECFNAAKDIVAVATAQANAEMDEKDAAEQAALMTAVGASGTLKARAERANRGAFKDLETRQKSRRTRAVRDRLDQALTDLLSYYRDVLVLQLGKGEIEVVNLELTVELQQLATNTKLTNTRARMEAIERARRLLGSNAQPQMILESLTIELARG